MMRESLAKVLEGDVNIASHTLLPPIKAKPAETPAYEESESPRARYVAKRPPMPRNDPAGQRVLASARRILGRPKLAMYLVDLQYPGDASHMPHVLRLLQAVVDVAIRFPDEPNMGALLEQFRDTEFASDVSRLITSRDTEVDATATDEEAEADLRQLRAQIEDGSLFPNASAIAMPENLGGVGILALGTRRPNAPGAASEDGPTALPPPPMKAGRTFTRPDARPAKTAPEVTPPAGQSPAQRTHTPPTPEPKHSEPPDDHFEHDGMSEPNYAVSSEDDIPFEFDDDVPPRKPTSDGHDAPF